MRHHFDWTYEVEISATNASQAEIPSKILWGRESPDQICSSSIHGSIPYRRSSLAISRAAASAEL
jgi:hypothetical protein